MTKSKKTNGKTPAAVKKQKPSKDDVAKVFPTVVLDPMKAMDKGSMSWTKATITSLLEFLVVAKQKGYTQDAHLLIWHIGH